MMSLPRIMCVVTLISCSTALHVGSHSCCSALRARSSFRSPPLLRMADQGGVPPDEAAVEAPRPPVDDGYKPISGFSEKGAKIFGITTFLFLIGKLDWAQILGI